MKAKKPILIIWILLLLVPAMGARQVNAAPEKWGICNGPEEPWMILVMGTDQRNRGYMYGHADTVMVFRVDFQNDQVDVMSFTRNLWVEIPGIEDDTGRTHGKLHQAYFYGTKDMGYFDGKGYGGGLMAATLKANYGLEVDNYLVINMYILREVIDAIGGVKIYNPSPIYSHTRPTNKPVIPAGGYFFNGKDALKYARLRDPRNVLDRLDRHSIVLNALYRQIFSVEVVPRIPYILGVFKGNVLTDMHLAQISQLLCQASRVGWEEVRYHRIPEEWLYEPDWVGSVNLEKNPGSVAELMAEFEAGTLTIEE